MKVCVCEREIPCAESRVKSHSTSYKIHKSTNAWTLFFPFFTFQYIGDCASLQLERLQDWRKTSWFVQSQSAQITVFGLEPDVHTNLSNMVQSLKFKKIIQIVFPKGEFFKRDTIIPVLNFTLMSPAKIKYTQNLSSGRHPSCNAARRLIKSTWAGPYFFGMSAVQMFVCIMKTHVRDTDTAVLWISTEVLEGNGENKCFIDLCRHMLE